MEAKPRYDVLVIGGGHAGAEAAWAASRLLRAQGDRPGHVGLVTLDADKIGQMSCNPAIGGLAKGQMVHEIDAMGGLMGLAIDATGIQFRMLNRSKGPAVRGPRAQADKYAYAREVQRLLNTRDNLDIISASMEGVLVEQGRCVGAAVRDRNGHTFNIQADAVVLTTGTFMRGLMHTGHDQTPGGRVGEGAAVGISDNLQQLGFELGRLKTGTPPRLAAESIDFASLDEQWGDDPPSPFSTMTGSGSVGDAYDRVASRFPVIDQRPCWLSQTTEAAHDKIRANLDRAPMYTGQIDAECGPRYCPSIEDKVVRFADKPSHTVFLEPESLETNEIYCNGISTSLPADVQDFIVQQLPGCERATILRYGYAVEYDMVWPHQIDATTMTKRVPGLFLAGQINGTSGYEEAAGQGMLAGLNAVRLAAGEDLIRLGRDAAYIGVMMDDLVTKTPREPYRMFTSRAEHRLLLRADNAAERLTPMARELGLIDDTRWGVHQDRTAATKQLHQLLSKQHNEGQRLIDWIKRPEVEVDTVLARLGEPIDRRVVESLLSTVKYAGFIERHERDHRKVREMEAVPLPTDFDYRSITGLRNEAGDVLNRFRPTTLGQASRLAGITPADLTVLAMRVHQLA